MMHEELQDAGATPSEAAHYRPRACSSHCCFERMFGCCKQMVRRVLPLLTWLQRKHVTQYMKYNVAGFAICCWNQVRPLLLRAHLAGRVPLFLDVKLRTAATPMRCRLCWTHVL